jgi:hypothetical protein
MVITNAFSLNMIDLPVLTATFRHLTVTEAAALAAGASSAVGHADTAAVFSSVLGVPVPMNRATVTLAVGDQALVGQYSGPRLAEGTTTLPKGASIRWVLVTVG